MGERNQRHHIFVITFSYGEYQQTPKIFKVSPNFSPLVFCRIRSLIARFCHIQVNTLNEELGFFCGEATADKQQSSSSLQLSPNLSASLMMDR
jgi:hypothetical protein